MHVMGPQVRAVFHSRTHSITARILNTLSRLVRRCFALFGCKIFREMCVCGLQEFVIVLTRQYVVAYVASYCVMQTFCQGGESTDWTIRCSHPLREKDLFLLQQVPTSSRVYSASLFPRYEPGSLQWLPGSFLGRSGLVVILTTCLHQTPK